ncbi:MAG: hypothetical protein ACXWZ3_12880 [Solirubrobacterales bacterium]
MAISPTLRSGASQFGSEWWTIGFAIAFVAWALGRPSDDSCRS